MTNDKFIGEVVEGYVIQRKLGKGAIGTVYLAHREDIDDNRAVKFIKINDLRPDWDNEIRKTTRLRRTEGVVKYHSHNFIEILGESYLYMSWEYIPGESLKELIEKREITLPIIVDTFEKVLEILHACKQAHIEHADLHSGNILVENFDPLSINPEQRRVWVTDFGYATAAGNKDILDDFLGLDRIVQTALREIDFHILDGKAKHIFSVLKNDISRMLTERNVALGEYVRDPRAILYRFRELCKIENRQSDLNTNIGDYLAAEHIGERFDEWKKLFVPKFLSIEELLTRNICVLTGQRGCGKTTIFRRLTALYNVKLGSSGVQGDDSFIGFYLNARNIAEAFPWLPEERESLARNQVINFFHLSWCLEIVEWLREEAKVNTKLDLSWLSSFFKQYYPDHFTTSEHNSYILDHIMNLLVKELERSRLKSGYIESDWELTDLSFLEKICREISRHCVLQDKPFYFFLDDYSTPMVNSSTQKILNPIIFRRSPTTIFKIATESIESFEPYGLNGKILEEDDDFKLIDFGTQVIIRKSDEVNDILSSILLPRIDRHPLLRGRDLTIRKVLGETKISNADLARLIRNEIVELNGRVISKELYHGYDVFCNIWSSDIRESISLFANMVSIEESDRLSKIENNIISDEVQDKVLREAGGTYLSLIAAATNPSSRNYSVDEGLSYGNHLVEIIRCFQEIASFDLKNKNSKNQGSNPPKQPRRIEITGGAEELFGAAKDFYKGLIRYGIFIRDNRGKSVRGKTVPRLYLRGLLIPYFRLTFSKRDSITMSWPDFIQFLEQPKQFRDQYIKGMKLPKEHNGTNELQIEWEFDPNER